jgi:hypothetical protein
MPFLDEPYFAVGTGVPDWLTVVDRGVRVRLGDAEALAADADPPVAAVAGGIAQHLRDDARFHESRAFAELSLELTVRSRDVLGGETGFRPSFLGHLLVEVLLDATLAAEDVRRLEEYDAALARVEPTTVEEAVNRVASRPTARLAAMISAFRHHRILWDYLEDGKLLGRLDQVMRRVGFDPLPEAFGVVLPDARNLVAGRAGQLLEGIPVR